MNTCIKPSQEQTPQTVAPAPIAASSSTPLFQQEPEESGTPFWRNVSDEDVRRAIAGSFLSTICDAYAKNYTPHAPMPLLLMQSILLMSAALTHKKTDERTEQLSFFGNELLPVEDDPDTELAPARNSRLVINTGLGNVPNVYVLMVAPSGTGKGLGQFQLLRKLGYREISSGSLEGVKDAAMDNPHILISLQEFGSVLEGKGYKEDFKKGLTDMFNAGRFEEALSSRKSKDPRSCNWFYPCVYASVQPEVLRNAGRSMDLAQGLFSRFLVGYISPAEEEYDINPCNPDGLEDLKRIQSGLGRISLMSGVVNVPDPCYNTTFSKPIQAIIDERMKPVLKRYANEYLPRIALMLAIPDNTAESTGLEVPVLTEDHFSRATVVLHRILTMAEEAFGSLNNLKGRSRQREDDLGKMARLLQRLTGKGSGIVLKEISRNSSGSGWDQKIRT